jgi:TRAP-type C4-dicarboxylate transport system substrate-binding protein
MFRHTLFSLATLALVATGAAAQTTVKVATVAPVNSSYHKAMLDMGAEWEAKTSGRVKLTVYAGGTQGSEEATLRMMRPGVDQLQGGLLMLPGLSSIDDGFSVFGIPFLFASDAEAKHVLERMGPTMEKRMESRGFKVLAWGSAGWVQLFSKNPLNTLADIKTAKIFTTQGDDRMVQWYKQNGFRPVPLTSGDIPAQLRLPNGMIDAAPMPPYAASLMQVYRDAKYMLDVDFAPLFGALVMTTSAWNKLSADDKAAVSAAAKNAEKRLLGEAVQLDTNSITAMKTRGLTVNTPDAKALAAFRSEADRLVATIRGTLVPADVYDAVVRERDAFRKTKKP